MNLKSRIDPCKPLFWEDAPLEDKCYVYCPQEKDFFILESVEYEIWKEVIKGGRTMQDIIAAVGAVYKTDGVDVVNDISDFLGILAKKELIVILN